MEKSFEDALLDLLAQYRDADPQEIITALEVHLMALREEHGED